MPLIPKVAGTASLLSTIKDIHKTAMIYSTREYNKASGNETLAISIGNQKADYVSFKDAQRKNWVNENQYFTGLPQAYASVKGYFKGAVQGITRYLPKFVLSALAIIPKSNPTMGSNKIVNAIKNSGKTVSYASAILLAGYEIFDFLKNGTELFERRNYLERK